MHQQAKQKGQGLVEYLILLCLIAVSAITVVGIVGRNIREQYANISAALRREKKVKMTPVDQEAIGPKGMDNYMDGNDSGGEGEWE